MKRVVAKYPLVRHTASLDDFRVVLPEQHSILHLGRDETGQTCLWVQVTPETEPKVPLDIIRIPNFTEFDPKKWQYLTTQLDQIPPYVWHYFIRP